MVIIIWENHLENPNFGKTMGILYVFVFFKYWGIIQIVFFFWILVCGIRNGILGFNLFNLCFFFFTAIIWVGHLSLCETNHGKILPGIRGEHLCDSRKDQDLFVG